MLRLTRSNSFKYFAAIGLFCVVEFAIQDSPALGMSSWRLLSRQASEDREAKNFQAAEIGYERAIEALKSENSKADEIYSLQLLLVETYRRSGKYHKAREILSRMEPAIKAEKYVDPTIAVRFWRRMAEVESSAGSTKTGLLYYRRAISILEKYFEPISSTLQKNYVSLLMLACEESDYDTIIETLNKLSETATKQNVMANGAIESAIGKLAARTQLTAEQGNYNEAFRQLKNVTGPSFRVANRAELWIAYGHICLKNSKFDEALKTVPILFHLTEEAKTKLPQNESVPLRMKLHLSIGTIFSKGSEKEKAQCVPQFRKALSVSNELKAPLPFLIRSWRVIAIEGIATGPCLMFSSRATDEAVKLMQEPIEFSVIPPKEKFAASDLKVVKDSHITARICLAITHLSRRDPVNAEKALVSIDRNLMKSYPSAGGSLAIANLYIDVSRLYFSENKRADCDRALAEAKKLTEGIQASPELNSLLEKYKAFESEIKTSSNALRKGTAKK